MKKILAISPTVNSAQVLEDRQRAASQFNIAGQLLVDYSFLDIAPTSVENEIDDALCVPDLLRRGLAAQEQGYDGILIDCMCDPGLRALRTALDIAVVGAAETAFHVAASLCHKFSVIEIGDDTGPMVEALVVRYGVRQSFASTRSTGIVVADIGLDRQHTLAMLAEKSVQAIEEDGADLIVLGCTGFSGCEIALKDALMTKGYKVPVINPRMLGIRILTALVLNDLIHSKIAWPTPSPSTKHLVGFSPEDPILACYP